MTEVNRRRKLIVEPEIQNRQIRKLITTPLTASALAATIAVAMCLQLSLEAESTGAELLLEHHAGKVKECGHRLLS